MKPVDQRHLLKAEVFSFFTSQAGQVFISWRGKPVKTLAGPAAQKFLQQISGLDEYALQLALARVTGNFKRGNEKLSKRRDV